MPNSDSFYNPNGELNHWISGSGKIHISAFRILFLLKILNQSDMVFVTTINNHLINHPLIGRAFVSETLQKHLYTIQLSGWKIGRHYKDAQWYYQVEFNPLKYQFSLIEQQLLLKLLFLLRSRPIYGDVDRFLRLLKTMSSAEELQKISSGSLAVASRNDSALHQKIQHLESFILDNQVLEITFQHPNGQTQTHLIEPLQVHFDNHKALLVSINTETNKKCRYDIERIETFRQLPSRSRTRVIMTTVHFKLTGRLARGYRRYPNEQIQDKGDTVLVTHTTDDIETLLLRLLKYGASCEVLSPRWARELMAKNLQQLAHVLEAPVDAQLTNFVSNRVQTTEIPHK